MISPVKQKDLSKEFSGYFLKQFCETEKLVE